MAIAQSKVSSKKSGKEVSEKEGMTPSPKVTPLPKDSTPPTKRVDATVEVKVKAGKDTYTMKYKIDNLTGQILITDLNEALFSSTIGGALIKKFGSSVKRELS